VRAKTSALFLALFAVAGLTLPITAAAKPHSIRLPGGFTISAKLPRSNGYELLLENEGHDRLSLVAERDGVVYDLSAPARATRDGIEAHLGPFGRIDARFEQIGPAKKRRPLRGCHGRDGFELQGVLRGTIRFRGRRGFASVHAGRVPARVVVERASTCPRPAARAKPKHEPDLGDLTEFAAVERGHGRLLGLVAAQAEEDGKGGEAGISVIFAFAERHYGRVRTSDVVLATDGFSVSDPGVDPETAAIFGVDPLRGEAEYSSDLPRAERWSGSLRAPLPGEGVVPLTGPDFRSVLCRESTELQMTRCLERGIGQTSGSQSQSLFDTRLSWSR
jgi:hypothetical protein